MKGADAMGETFQHHQTPIIAGGAKRRVWVAMVSLFTAALVASLAWGIYGIATS